MAPERERPLEPPESEVDADDERRLGPLEALFQDFLRRAAALGFSSLFFTERAVRGALSETVPKEWVDYASRQGDDLRAELIRSLSLEFGQWLRSLDVPALLSEVLREGDLSVRLELSSEPKRGEGEALQVLSRRR